MFKGFYKKKISERRAMIDEFRPNLHIMLKQLPESVANNMIENYLMNYELPLGVAVNFTINEEAYVVPMAVEEPSVIAAASNAGKILGNIQTSYGEREIVGQIVLAEIDDPVKVLAQLEAERETLLSIAKDHAQNMVRRGGGPLGLRFEHKMSEMTDYIVIYLTFNPCDAMGANAVNTCLEAMAPHIEAVVGQDALMRILSNYSETAIARAETQVMVAKLHQDREQAHQIAKRISMASDYASIDIYRATTHNKGIMNGIDAVAIATGNDWRAIEASVHAYASRTGNYQPLTRWTYDAEAEILLGSIELPLPVAVVGGTISVHPIAQWSLELLNQPSASQLSQIMAAVGLAQNFGAIRALVTEGIQKGHMSLQARSLAMQVGATEEEVEPLVAQLKASPTMSSTVAADLLEQLRGQVSEERKDVKYNRNR